MSSYRMAVLAMVISALALMLNLVPVAVKLGWIKAWTEAPAQQAP